MSTDKISLAAYSDDIRLRRPGTPVYWLLRARERCHHLLEPSRGGDHASRAIDVLLLALILLNVAAVLAESIETLRLRFEYEFYVFELISVAAFTVEYFCRVWASVEQYSGDRSRSAFIVRIKYMMTPMALVDLFAVAPFYIVVSGLFGMFDMRMLRLLRLLRLFKLSRYSAPLILFWQVLRENAANFAAALGILLIIMILASSGIYFIEHDVQPEAFGSIPAAMWWAFATLTTVGYGDVTPITPIGKVFGAAITVVSIGIVALPAGLLASSFSERLRQKSQVYRHMADRAAGDGIVTDQERAMLEQERRELGLGEDLAETILQDEKNRFSDGCCPTCGHSPDRE